MELKTYTRIKYSCLMVLRFLSVRCADNFTWRWIDNNDLFDCVCGISYNDKPLSIGIFFDLNLVLTSATPIEPYLHKLSSLKVHSIYGAADKVANWPVTCATTPYRSARDKYWLPLGYDSKHSGRHDLMVLFASSPPTYDLAPEAVNASYRHAFSMFLATPHNRILPKDFLITGFGYIDKDHIERMNDLEVELNPNEVLVDCDDYMPRDWGRFICIKNFGTVGVQSGSPLLQRNLIYGIGSFALEKGEDKIYVFTDVRHYVKNLHFCQTEGNFIQWSSRYW